METWKYWIWQKNHFIYYVCIKLVNYILILHGIFCLLAFYIWLDWPQRPKHVSKSPPPRDSRRSRSVSKSPKPRNSRRSQSMSKSPKPRISRRSQSRSRSRSRSGSLSRSSFLMCLFFVDHINCWSFFNWLEKWLCGQSLGRLMHNHYKCLLTLSFHIEVISCRLVFVTTIKSCWIWITILQVSLHCGINWSPVAVIESAVVPEKISMRCWGSFFPAKRSHEMASEYLGPWETRTKL